MGHVAICCAGLFIVKTLKGFGNMFIVVMLTMIESCMDTVFSLILNLPDCDH